MLSAAGYMARNVTAVLREVGMWNNTLFIFSSDSGGPASKKVSGSAANNYPLRGGKHTAWEGGHQAISFVVGGLVRHAWEEAGGLRAHYRLVRYASLLGLTHKTLQLSRLGSLMSTPREVVSR
eukprot:Sspe_Gene.50153::Locus_27669_Transcript_4_10_Confidence_0.441_Length_1085::g.50153::m.50153